MSRHSKKGFHYSIVIIIVMAIIIIGLLAYVFWQSMQNNKTNQSATNTNTAQTNTNTNTNTNANTTNTTNTPKQLTYSDANYTLSYPSDWTARKPKSGDFFGDKDNQDSILIYSNDFDAVEKIGLPSYEIKKGAIIEFSTSKNDGRTVEQIMEQAKGIINNWTISTVDGVKAASYNNTYEINYYATILVKNSKDYQIRLYTIDGQRDNYMSVYNSLLSSLHIK